MRDLKLFPLGDRALTIVFGDEIDQRVNDNVLMAQKIIKEALIEGVKETVPTYCTLMVHFDTELIGYELLSKKIEQLLSKAVQSEAMEEHRHITLPVLYGGEYGPDIKGVALNAEISEQEVINLHTSGEYRVYMLGFLAGFPYLGGLNPKLRTPRLESPRVRIEPGSVGIAGMQTGAYPIASPGGWQLIGRTPLKLYDINCEEPALLRAGDIVRFKSIDETEYKSLLAAERPEPKAASEEVKEPVLTLLNPGLLSTVQDQGRRGYQSMGVSVSGAMDKSSAVLANMLVGNKEGAAVIESMMMGPTIRFEQDTTIAVTGANAQISLNGASVPEYKRIEVKQGDVLEVGGFTAGMFSYIAVSGGIDVPEVLGSRSTHIRSNIGEALIKGTKLAALRDIGETKIPEEACFKTVWHKEIELRVVPDRFADRFTFKGIKTFYTSEYELTQQSDRMGFRLSGPKVEHSNGADIITDGVIMGSIQIPPNGQPIIMMADCQTTGGYTRIANIVSEDLPKLAQAGPGARIRFVEVK